MRRVARAGGRACWWRRAAPATVWRLPADALVRPRVACSLPAASVLSLGGVRGWEVSHVKKRRSTRLVSEQSERDRS